MHLLVRIKESNTPVPPPHPNHSAENSKTPFHFVGQAEKKLEILKKCFNLKRTDA